MKAMLFQSNPIQYFSLFISLCVTSHHIRGVLADVIKVIIHLAQLIPWLFLKPGVCKYQIIVIKSEIYILLSKPYYLMCHLVCGNRVRNGRERRPQTHRMRSPKVAL